MGKKYGIGNESGTITVVELAAHWDKFDGKEVRFDNPEEMAQNAWLYLTNDTRPAIATIKKEAFLHEVTAMIEIAIEYQKHKSQSNDNGK